MNYIQGSSADYGKVAVDAYVAIEFSGKTLLNIVGGAGTDTITLNNPTTPTGLTSVVVNEPAANQAPTLNDIANPAAISMNASLQTVALSGIGDGDDGTQSLQVTVFCDNLALIPTPAVTYTSPNSTGSISYTPATTQFWHSACDRYGARLGTRRNGRQRR